MGSDMSDDEGLLNHEDKHDLEQLDRMNSTFVAAAFERQCEQGFCDASSTEQDDGAHTDLRPFEDELGESMLQQFQNKHSSRNSQPADQEPVERSKVGIQTRTIMVLDGLRRLCESMWTFFYNRIGCTSCTLMVVAASQRNFSNLYKKLTSPVKFK